jgi:hypothetical protein
LQFDPIAFLAKTGEGRAATGYASGQVIFARPGRSGRRRVLCADRAGQADHRLSQGKEAVVGILFLPISSGSELGGSAAPHRHRHGHEECLIRLAKSAMIHPRRAHLLELFWLICCRATSGQANLVDQLFSSSEKRLARVLLLLANFGKEGKPEAVIPKITQETLAEMIGTTRSRVSFFMNKFRKLGFIEYNGKLSVHSSLLNVVLHD